MTLATSPGRTVRSFILPSLYPSLTPSHADANKFGAAYLEKFGWASGSGLGAEGEGRTKHIPVYQKLDMLGIGADHRNSQDGTAWKQGKDFENLLRRLNAAGGDEAATDAPKIDGFVKPTAAAQGDAEGSVEESEKEQKEERKSKKRKRAEKEDEDGDAQDDEDEERRRRKKEKKERKAREKEEKAARKASKKEKKREETAGKDKEKKRKREASDDEGTSPSTPTEIAAATSAPVVAPRPCVPSHFGLVYVLSVLLYS